MKLCPAGASFKSWTCILTSVAPFLWGVANTFSRTTLNAPVNTTSISASAPVLYVGMFGGGDARRVQAHVCGSILVSLILRGRFNYCVSAMRIENRRRNGGSGLVCESGFGQRGSQSLFCQNTRNVIALPMCLPCVISLTIY